MENLTAKLEIRLTPERLAELEAVARMAGISASAAARLAIARLIADTHEQTAR
jgi:hypothetical protein